MFSPLIEMGKKMNTTDIDNLEYIIYKREDEISSLVDAYNRMEELEFQAKLQMLVGRCRSLPRDEVTKLMEM